MLRRAACVTLRGVRIFVYVLRDPRNGEPFYVGQGVGRRIEKHSLAARRQPSARHSSLVRKRIVEIGRDPTVEYVARGLSPEKADALERELIAEYGRADLKFGPLLNRTEGGRFAGRRWTARERAKVSRSLRGREFSAEHRANLSAAQKGRRYPPEARENMSKAHLGKKYGRRSPEWRANIAAGIKAWHERRRIKKGVEA